jgi:Ca2+-binding EF-hand superfamily protein
MARPIPFSRLLLLAAALLLQGGAVASTRAAEQGEDFAITDRNSDGFIDRGEFYERMVEQFFFADSNRDGRLVPAELPGVPAEVFKGADRDGDGVLGLPEFTEAREADFDKADTNKDGLLSRAEAEAAAAGNAAK